MNNLTPLSQPMNSQVVIDPTAKDCPSHGFNYPAFKQLNKQARVYLSQRFNLNTSVLYQLFAVANSKGWFGAVQASPSASNILFSTLEDLRSAFAVADTSTAGLFSPKRSLPITSSNVNIIAFATNDTRLVVGLENGSIAIYDTALLFTSGKGEIPPLRAMQLQSSPFRQILPNPGTDPNLSDLLAVVGDGKVLLFNTQLEPQGGWTASDLMTQPISISWSPKGKHIGIGLQTGDILTFSLTQKSTPNKHIPPTADAILVSLHWLGPGHVFQTTYAAQDNSPAKQHIITLDAKSSTATYVAPDHPFPAHDRTQQNAYLLNFPKWDVDHTSEESTSLTIVADFSSVDIEILGNIGTKWFRQSQDNPLTLPLDNSMDDTVLVAFDADLTDQTAGVPIVYAYLNDGSLQGWHAEHSKRYTGLLSLGTSTSVVSQSQDGKDTEMVSDSATPTPAPTFGQSDSPFGQKPTVFGQTAFGRAQSTPAFGQPSFSQAFGQSSQTSNTTTSAFSSLKPATGFGAFASTGTGSFGSTPSAFSGFGSSASTFSQESLSSAIPAKPAPAALSTNISPTITQEASMSDSTTGFGGLNLGTTTSDSKLVNSMFGSFGTPTSTDQTKSSSFGSGGLVKPATGFGAFVGFKISGAFDPNNKSSSTVNAFASPVTEVQTTSSGFGQTGFGQPGFGQTGFGSGLDKAAFGQPAFGKTSFGTPPTTTTTAPTSGGFGAFSNTSTGFTKQSSGFGIAQESKPEISGGFAAFGSATQTPFRSTSSPSATSFADASSSKQPLAFGGQESKPEVSGGFAAFGSPTSKPLGSAASTSASGFTSISKGFGAFTSTSPTTFTSALGSKSEPSNSVTPVSTRTSVFGTPLQSGTVTSPPFSKDTVVSTTPKEAPTRTITMSPPSSPEPKPASIEASPSPQPVMGSAFANIQTTPSSFQPATGFGAFGSMLPKDSPFFKKSEQTPPPSPFTPISSKISGSTATAPTFGSTSVLGPSKSVFATTTPSSPTPVKSTPPPSFGGSAFSAFSGSSSPLAAVVGQKKSFSDLLKTGGEENKDPEKPSALLLPTKPKGESNEAKPQETRPSVFGTPTKGELKMANVFLATSFMTQSQDKEAASEYKEKGKVKDAPAEGTSREESFSNISESSSTSSFVEVEIPTQGGEVEPDEKSDQDDRSDFLTDEELSGEEPGSDEESLPEEEAKSPTPSATAVPLPPSRSPSATPQPEIKIQVSDVGSLSVQDPPSREESTTPPGTPVKELKSFGSNGTASPLGIGLGRPSTRPVRRSPLANTVVLAEDESQEEAASDLKKPEEISSGNPRAKTPTISTSVTPGSLPTPPSATSSSSGVQTPSLDALPKKPTVPAPSSTFSFAQRPATTPPASSLFGQAAEKSTPTVIPSPVIRATTAPTPSSSQQGLFGAQSTLVPGPTIPNLFNIPAFTLGKTPPPVIAGTMGVPSLPPKALQHPSPLFGVLTKQLPAVPGASTPSQASKTQVEEVVEEGMQRECVNLVKTVEKEFQELAKTAANARHVFATLNMSLGGSKNKEDLGNPARWGLADVKLFGQLLLQYENELAFLESNRDKEKQSIGEIKSNILKAGTRREEIARFNKAKDDKEFAKMLKARTLGPEHSETQTQLRKSIRAVRDRVQKLEKRLHGDKRTLAEAQSCKPRIKAPSLDTINRTFRNIGIAIEQQTDEINRLATRISKINIADTAAASSLSGSSLVRRDARLPDPPNPRRPINITPHVAVTTAAALNAERSAQKLKRALLAVRKEPLLNTKAATSPIAPLSFNSPSRPESDVKGGKMKGFEDLKGPLFSVPTAEASELGMNDWDLPEDHFDPSGSHMSLGSSSARRDKQRRTHRGGSSVRKSPGVESPAKLDASVTPIPHTPPASKTPVSFDWGPLPTFPSPTPLKSLPSSFVPISPPAQNAPGGTDVPKPPEPQKSLPKGFISFSTFSA